jgi:glycosyltransferase involved in cell wall biosynthesis
MKIFYDHTAFARQKYGGISKYFCELLKNIPPENWCLSVSISNNQYIEEARIKKTLKFLPNVRFQGKEGLMERMGFPYTLYKLRAEQWDVFHSTSFADRYGAAIPVSKPVVVTAHDALFSLYFKDNKKRNRIVEGIINFCKRADKIIAISENTKRDYIQYYGADENKIKVIHHGVDKQKKEISKARIENNPYLLFVGLRHDYKNFLRLAKVFVMISVKHPDLKLVCTGFPFSDDEKKELSDLHILDKTRLIFASEQEMAQLYHDAEMFVYPSLYEGFGMPILEAMVYDCPVVLSNTSCFPEIAQEAGIYFNPYEVEDIADKILLTLGNSTLRKQKIALGKERLMHFSWEKCAGEHMKIYQSLI